MIKKLLLVSFVICTQSSVSQEMNIKQKEGLIQNQEDKHIAFRHFNKFEPNSASGIIGAITKIIIHDEFIYILDGRQSRIFVFDRKATYLYSIGRPGQGPGDLEHPSDFYITDKGFIYVLNSLAKRIEVFSIKGIFIKRIELILPKEIFYSYPSGILVGQAQEILVTYALSQHLIDIYDESGKHIKTLLNREDEVLIPGENLGNCSQIQFYPQEKAILHFDYFTGLFTKISITGKIEKQFSVYDALQNKETSKIKNDISAGRNAGKPNVSSVKEFQLWSRSCMDKDQNVFVFLLLKKQTEKQKMFVFSSKGDFLYWKYTPSFINTAYVDDICCFRDSFFFKTPDDEIFMANIGQQAP